MCGGRMEQNLQLAIAVNEGTEKVINIRIKISKNKNYLGNIDN